MLSVTGAHDDGFDPSAVAERQVSRRALDRAPEPLPEVDRAGVVNVGSQLEAAQAKPVVGEVQRGDRERAPDASPLDGGVDGHPEVRAKAPTRVGLEAEAERADHPRLDLAHQGGGVWALLGQAPSRGFARAEGELRRGRDDVWAGKDGGDRLRLARIPRPHPNLGYDAYPRRGR